MSISKLLNKKQERVLFTTPSHNQAPKFNQNLAEFYKYDFSELDGFDNLSNPRNSIMVSQAKVSECLGAKQSFFVIQGATTAMLAAMKALIAPGDRVLAARNCHKCVFNGLILTAGIVDWFIPDEDENWGIYTEINPKKLERTLELNDYKVFIMVSPTYEGINSDIEQIANICRAHDTYLIVDEAHGSLYNFSEALPKTAIAQGADVSVNSLHKTAGALNQTALLNISKQIKNVEIEVFQQSLNLFQTTSPSYPLLANIEACINYLNSKEGKDEIESLILEIQALKPELERYGVEFYKGVNHDPTKILLRKEGVSCDELSDTLFEEFSIEDEMNSSNFCLYLTGIGTTKAKLDRLKHALKKVKTNPSWEFPKIDFQPYPMVKIQPVDTFNLNYGFVSKQDALLKISNKMILPYPPGVGLLYPGEAIQKWHLDYLDNNIEVII